MYCAGIKIYEQQPKAEDLEDALAYLLDKMEFIRWYYRVDSKLMYGRYEPEKSLDIVAAEARVRVEARAPGCTPPEPCTLFVNNPWYLKETKLKEREYGFSTLA